jgi:putative sterol carrier protein
MPTPISSCQEYFDTLQDRFVVSAAKGVTAVYQFELSGPGGGTWHISIADGAMSVHNGPHPDPSSVVTAEADDYVKIANGTMNGLRAVMTRRMKISGNLVLARKMQAMLPTG